MQGRTSRMRKAIGSTLLGGWIVGASIHGVGSKPARADDRHDHNHAPANASWADALFNEHAHDFGPVPRGSIVRHDFVLNNRTAEPVTILDVRASCGCTTGRAAGTPIAPGGSGIVEAQMDTRNFVGNKETVLTVSVVSASGRTAEARLGVRSLILSDIVLNPGMVDFGVVARGQPMRRILTIERMGAPHWRATRMMASKQLARSVDAKLDPVASADGGVSYRLTVDLRPEAPAGPLLEEVRVVTNDPDAPILPILVRADVRGTLSVAPEILTLGRATTGDPAEARCIVRAVKPFAISGIEGQGDGFEVEAADPGVRKAIHVLTVRYQPGPESSAGDVSRTFAIQTDLTGEPPVTVRANARYEP